MNPDPAVFRNNLQQLLNFRVNLTRAGLIFVNKTISCFLRHLKTPPALKLFFKQSSSGFPDFRKNHPAAAYKIYTITIFPGQKV
jgi:hypothetical protein